MAGALFPIEICCASLQDARNARDAGAQRIELNSALSAGGLTPSWQLLEKIKRECDLPVICMVRPREGGFCYDEDERELMFAMARELLEHGADGIAFGFLDESGHPDWPSILRMAELCHSHQAKAVFHRAFDVCADPFNSAVLLEKAGVDRLLTSGQEANARAGLGFLETLKSLLSGTMEICAGCGVNAENAPDLILAGAADSLHASCSSLVPDLASLRGPVSFSVQDGMRPQGSLNAMLALRKAADEAAARRDKEQGI